MNLPERGPGQVRIGIAIEIPEPYAAQLSAARVAADDPLANFIPPHITLLGPTLLDAGRLAEAREHLAAVAAAAPPFTVRLRGTATFRPISPVVFVALAQGISECERLEASVRTGILDGELRFNYHPHVTIAHEVPDADLDKAFEAMADYSADFDVDRFYQYEHGDDGIWRPQAAFPLGV
ncbi:2'-5' RNA ligase family protein [Promicromonospora sp. MEB111]|uniref:2'-5' RNA ligase family protein n=1 Tax=unclassified Promicromonospora TaxID=2647929 RepID=UPI00254BF051|nr:2'-5' RNA ligase family protein [Promicromonospora sp. MEB111]